MHNFPQIPTFPFPRNEHPKFKFFSHHVFHFSSQLDHKTNQVSMLEDELNEKAAAQVEMIANIASMKEELQSREAQLKIFEVSWYLMRCV